MNSKFLLIQRLQNAFTANERSVALNDITEPYASNETTTMTRQPLNNRDEIFAQQMDTQGITLKDIAKRITQPLPKTVDIPAWAEQILNAYDQDGGTPVLNFNVTTNEQENLRFLTWLDPMIRLGLNDLRVGIQAILQDHPNAPFEAKPAERLMFTNLPYQLVGKIERTLVLELNIARVEGRLQGTTARERFDHFISLLGEREFAEKLLADYPVLARQVHAYIQQWVSFSLRFLRHLAEDMPQLRATFSLEADPGHLIYIEASGDRHAGQQVAIVRFASGLRVVYKPRSLSTDQHFQTMLLWLNKHGFSIPFTTLRVMDLHDHGWCEFVEYLPCNSAVEAHHFYYRMGGYLALLYSMQAVDFHHENIIACGEHPVLIDLESLFHPQLAHDQQTSNNPNTHFYSVLRVGLLPQRMWSDEDGKGSSDKADNGLGIEISGLGGAAGQFLPSPQPYFDNIATDAVTLKRKKMQMETANNLPILSGKTLNAFDYSDDIEAGFREIYRILAHTHEALLAEDGPLAAFAHSEIRVILRATRTYSLLLRESFHPDVLQNAIERDRLYDRLWVAAGAVPHLRQVVPFERADLWRNDVPIFHTQPASTDLITSTGKRIANFFAESGYEGVQRLLTSLDEDDLERQCWLIHGALATLTMDSAHETNIKPRRVLRPPTQESQHEATGFDQVLLQEARKVGDRLAQVALRHNDTATWMGLTLIKQKYWALQPVGEDLYSGLPGIALFLGYLGHISGETSYTTLARAALQSLKPLWPQVQRHVGGLGAFAPLGGNIYALAHLGALWQDNALLDQAEDLAERTRALISQDEVFDVIGGAAGCIGALRGLHAIRPSLHLRALMQDCGSHLIDHVVPQSVGLGWPSLHDEVLGGFSHGSSGIAAMLLELGAITHDSRYESIAVEALRFERTLLSAEHGNWEDRRERPNDTEAGVKPSGEPEFMVAWCHGAPGIGLARLMALRHLRNKSAVELTKVDLEVAINTTINHGIGHNHSLCHGDLGNLDLLLQASFTQKNADLRAKVSELTTKVINSIHRYGYLCGVPNGIETPGLMTGLAGTGLQLLRLAKPSQVPSVLTLDPPIVDKDR